MLKIKNIAVIGIVIYMMSNPSTAFSQNDFSVSWNEHTTGDTVEDNPVGGSFTIKNIGENIIPINDTIWYGYLIDDEKYDLGLEIGLVSGQVLSDEFAPGEEIPIVNNFTWPEWESGITIEFCAVVFGIGVISFEGELFTGDDDPSNNTDCISAVLPVHAVSIAESQSAMDQLDIYPANNQLIIQNQSTNLLEDVSLNVFSLTGELVHHNNLTAFPGQNQQVMPILSKGVYLFQLNSAYGVLNKKVYIP